MTSTPSHRRGAAVTEQLMLAALELVAERRSTNISIDDVAQRAGVNKTTAYRRWSDTTTLVRDALVAHADTAVPIEPTGDTRADLIRLCTDVVANLQSPLGRSLIAAGQDTPEIQAMRSAFWTERLDAATELLDDLAPPTGADLVMERLVGPLHFRINERRLPLDPADIEAHVDHFLRGLRRP